MTSAAFIIRGATIRRASRRQGPTAMASSVRATLTRARITITPTIITQSAIVTTNTSCFSSFASSLSSSSFIGRLNKLKCHESHHGDHHSLFPSSYWLQHQQHHVQAKRKASSSSSSSQASKNEPFSPPPFQKVLIANRGEIASRVMRTCHRLGIDTVVVYTTADAKAPFVLEARETYSRLHNDHDHDDGRRRQPSSEAICIGTHPTDYLNVPNVLQAMKDTGAEAVHPGYGFLSENYTFCQAVQDAGVTWLGPSISAMQQMGDKLASKQLAAAAGVNVIPGYEGVLESVEHALELANSTVGYPVLLKAAAGGGGKGMRVCRNDTEIRETFDLAKAEASQFFADDRLLMEKFVERPHHIEFQVLSGPKVASDDDDDELDIVVFCERECSIQRRHQKIIEESPSPLLTEETRRAMVQQVKQLVKRVGYTSAGTVEFLVDEEQNFYFLEMNTRLQVEHPVTEMVSRSATDGEPIDLVKAMLWVGAGWGVPPELLHSNDDQDVHDGAPNYFPFQGHAVETRVYAEDPRRGFLPSTGPLLPYQEPLSVGNELRIDSGVAEGHVVTPHYDPMLSKVIAYGDTRIEAIDRLGKALGEYVIGTGEAASASAASSIQHNVRLVQDILMRNAAFRKGDTPTNFLDVHYPEGFQGVQLTLQESMELIAGVVWIDRQRQQTLRTKVGGKGYSSESLTGSTELVCKLGGMFGDGYSVAVMGENDDNDDDSCQILVQSLEAEDSNNNTESFQVSSPDTPYHPNDVVVHLSINGVSRPIQWLDETMGSGEVSVDMYGANHSVLFQTYREYELSQYMIPPKVVDTSNLVLSPMPGTLVSYSVTAGEQVREGQELCIVEAMKMQNSIRSPRAGTIGTLSVDVGSSLMADEVLLDFL